MGKKKKKPFILLRKDPNEDKEDTRPIEKRKKPWISMEWKKLKEILHLD